MKIACISDLHMGDGKSSDSFQHKENHFLSFLDFLEDQYDQIILNGDIFETYKSLKVNTPAEQLLRVQNYYGNINLRFLQKKYILIAGNHDSILESLGYPLSYLHQDENGGKYLFLHGHQFDPIRSSGIIPPAASWFFGFLERTGWKNAESYFSWIDEEIGYKTGKNNVFLLREGAKEICSDSKGENPGHVIMGHTHEMPGIIECGESTYINSGACLKGRIQFVHIDTFNRENRVYNYSITNRYGIALNTEYPRTENISFKTCNSHLKNSNSIKII